MEALEQPSGPGRSADASLPLAPIAKLLKEELSPGVKASADVVPMLQGYLSEYLHLLTSKAMEKANEQKKSTISKGHVLKTLEELGFAHYAATFSPVAEVAASANKQKRAKPRHRLPAGMTEEESLMFQQELFASAKAAAGAQLGS